MRNTRALVIVLLLLQLLNEGQPITDIEPEAEETGEQNGTHINPYPFHLVMSPSPCTDERVVIVVHSAAQYFERRILMRGTWLNHRTLEKGLGLKIKIVFITGLTLNATVLSHLEYEQEMYGDIVQSDFIDSYNNNTYKAISLFRWVSSERGCPNSALILKVDDDALIHSVRLPKLKAMIDRALNISQEDIYLGRLLTHTVDRSKRSKWYVSYDLWPHEKYPVWFQGLAYMLTPHLAAKLHRVALNTKYMYTDDVYVGILVSQVKGACVLIENMIGYNTRYLLKDFEKSFREDGRIFYHVPESEYFVKWYHLNSTVVRFDPLFMPKWKESMEDLRNV